MTSSCSRRLAAALFLSTALAGCVIGGDPDTQTLEGRVDRAGFDGIVLGARVVQGDQVVATSRLDADGRFTLRIPEGTGYRLEVITSTGARPTVRLGDGSLIAHTFDVCDPIDPFDLGDVHDGGSFPDDWWPEEDPDDTGNGGGCDPGPDGTCTDPDEPPPDPGCDGDKPPWCPPDVPPDQCWDPCEWDPLACEDPCALYPETCDPCAENPEWCEDPCLENPEWCEDPCENPGPDGSCDPCLEHPELCDPCLENPDMCDPCVIQPELCDDPCDPDPSQCDPCLEYPEMCDPCLLYPELCDPCLEHPELCECDNPGPDGTCWPPDDGCDYDDPNTDPEMCWPPDDEPCDANGICEPDDCAVPEFPIPDFGCEGGW